MSYPTTGAPARARTASVLAAATALALTAAALVAGATPAQAAPVAVNPLTAASGFTIVSFGDLELSNHEIEGSVAAGGDISTRSGSPYNVIHRMAGNGDYTLPTWNGMPVRVVVGGTFDRAGSSEMIRVSSDNSTTPGTEGRVVIGDATGLNVGGRGSGVCIQAAGVNDCSGVVLEQSRFAQTAAQAVDPAAFAGLISAQDIADLTSHSDRIAAGELVGTTAVTLTGSAPEYTMVLTDDTTNVWTIDAADFPTGDWKIAFGSVKPSATAPLVIRVVAADGATVNLPMEMIGAYSAPGSTSNNAYARYVLWNIQQSPGDTVTLTGDGIVPGSFLAPNSHLLTAPGKKTLLEGQVVAASAAFRNVGELHHYGFVPELEFDDGGATPATGGFAIHKTLSGPTGLVPAGTTFTVQYRVDGGTAQTLTLSADGTPVSVTGLATGAVVTFTEPSYPVVSGVDWTGHAFSPASVTVAAGASTSVTLANSFTASSTAPATPRIWSQAYVGGVANGTVTAAQREVLDVVFSENLQAGHDYRLEGELVFLDGATVVSTGITNAVPFTTAGTSGLVDGQLDSRFTVPESQLAALAGKKVFIFQTLRDAADDALVAFDGASVGTDPWFAATPEWFLVAVDAGSGDPGTGQGTGQGGDLAATGLTGADAAAWAAGGALGLGAVLLATTLVWRRLRQGASL